MKTAALTVIICMGAVAPLLADDTNVQSVELEAIRAAAPLPADDTNVLTDDRAKTSYAVGMSLGHNLQGADLDPDILLRGFKDEQSGGTTLLTPEEAQTFVRNFQQTLAANRAKMQAALAEKNKTEGDAFLAQNKDKPGVVTLPDGLQYKIITDGTGPSPTPADRVTVNYRGTFIDGTEFDSSAKQGHPVQFILGRVIRGWTEALLRMKVGSKWQLFIPPNLAYGPQGFQGIPPNAVLIFDVELLSIQTPNPPPAPPPASTPPPLTSDIIKVQGTNVEVIKPEDIPRTGPSQTP